MRTSQTGVGPLPATVNGVNFKAGGVILLPIFYNFSTSPGRGPALLSALRFPGTVAALPIDPFNKCDTVQ